MIVKEYGRGDTRLAVVGGTHGDEPMTAEAVQEFHDTFTNKFKENELDISVKFIVANEPALSKEVRYTEKDLNRSFPGDINSELYEERLATRIMSEVENCDAILSIHSSHSTPPRFAISSYMDNPTNQQTLLSLPFDWVVDTSQLRDTTLEVNHKNTVTIEAGVPGRSETRESAYQFINNFVRTHSDVLESSFDTTEKKVVHAEKTIHKSGGEPHVYYRNFETVPKGDIIAEDDHITHVSEDDNTVPILISEDGYDDIFGLLGQRIGELTEDGFKHLD